MLLSHVKVILRDTQPAIWKLKLSQPCNDGGSVHSRQVVAEYDERE